MPKNPSDPLYWARFGPSDEQDGPSEKTALLFETWIREGRLPEPPCHEGDPWSPEMWAGVVADFKRQSPPPGGAAFFQWLEDDLRSPDTIATLKAERRKWERHEKERSVPFLRYVQELEKTGVDRWHLLSLITGGTPDQPISVLSVLRAINFLAFMHGPWRQYRSHLRTLWRRYRNTLHLLEDGAWRRHHRHRHFSAGTAPTAP